MQKEISEKRLVQRLKNGDPQAVKYWFDHYYPQLFSLAQNKIGSFRDVEDVVQETMINCLKKIHVFRRDSSLKTWMMAVLRHEIADYYRKKYAKKAIQILPLGKSLLSEKIQESSEVELKVKQALNKMLDRRKSLLLMKYVDGMGVRQIARIMGKTFKSVESDLYRARESFKEIYATID